MKIKPNKFKQSLQQATPQIGMWVGMANSYSAEIIATAGYDWLLLDGEHAPNTLQSLLLQLQAIAPYASEPVIRPPSDDPVVIKQLLDIGAKTLLIPMVESAEQAGQLVSAMHYPPYGIRGVGSALARASQWNSITDYLHQADKEMCLLVQIESAKGLASLPEILNVEGVDGVFIGPMDLSAALGHLGNPSHPEVQKIIDQAIIDIKQAGKAAGILSASPTLAQHYLELGATFVAVGVDTSLLAKEAKSLLNHFKSKPSGLQTVEDSVY